MVKKVEHRWFRGWIRIVTGCCDSIVFGIGIFFMLLFMMDVLGYQKFVVVSGSMVPAIPVGSCILVKEKVCPDIKSGEILTFYMNHGQTAVTHRVLENDTAEQVFATGGDANASPDAVPVPYENCVGTVRLTIPLLGYLLVFLNTFYGKVSMMCLVIFCIGLSAAFQDTERRTIET